MSINTTRLAALAGALCTGLVIAAPAAAGTLHPEPGIFPPTHGLAIPAHKTVERSEADSAMRNTDAAPMAANEWEMRVFYSGG